ncbi:unnamed protein product [Phytophthora fragariaefolia]|uniref:Unnamed protein product n=1 Tax=Phytophthora fragariaefolia TaxID=1490495 RepID=A0A9W6TRJ6_9STRA|nr:unnamed protein product [Phytophthora fragariaefolia]
MQVTTGTTPLFKMQDTTVTGERIKNDTHPDVKALFKKQLKLRFGESYVEARVIDYFNNFENIVRENGLVEYFEGADGEKEKYKRLVANLHPEALKNEVKQCVCFTHKPAATNSRLLYHLFLKKAKEHNRQFLQLKQDKDKERDNLGRAKNPQNKKAMASNQTTTGEKRNRDGKAPATGSMTGKPASKPPPPLSNAALGAAYPLPKVQCYRAAQILDPISQLWAISLGTVTCSRSQCRDQDLGNPYPKPNIWFSMGDGRQEGMSSYTDVGPVEPMGAVDVLIVDTDDDDFIICSGLTQPTTLAYTCARRVGGSVGVFSLD